MKHICRYILTLIIVFTFCNCSHDNEEKDMKDTSINIGETSEMNVHVIYLQGNAINVLEYTAISQIGSLRPVFRIPSIVITNKGSFLVSCENRAITDDKDEIDILISRKGLDSSIWNIKRVFENNMCGRSMNPVFVIDRDGSQGKKGRIYLFVCHIKGDKYDIDTEGEYVDFVYKYSDDDGVSWSTERSLKDKWNSNEYTSVIPSPCNGIQIKDGTFLVPTMVIKNRTYRAGILVKRPHSDWYFSSLTHFDGDNECTVYVDNNGQIILDCRTFEKTRRRYVYDLDRNKFSLLSERSVYVDLKAEIHKIIQEDKNIYLMSFVDTKRDVRENLTLYASNDAMDWKQVYRMQEGTLPLLISAYSNPYSWEGQIVVAYETGSDIKVQEISHLKEDISSVLN